jgi:DNA polymerase elongation subunit (family B)
MNKKLEKLNFELSCAGRNIINLWIVAREYLKLKSYELPIVYEHLFGSRTCVLTDFKLNQMYASPEACDRARVL